MARRAPLIGPFRILLGVLAALSTLALVVAHRVFWRSTTLEFCTGGVTRI